MAFVPQYEHDVFVSYAHVDNEPLPGAEEGWVKTLVHGLEIKLAQKLGRREAFSIWMDQQLSRHVRFSPQIMEGLHASAILLLFLSPGYVASKWCLREKDSFLSLVEERKRSGSRVFVVEQDRLEDGERPQELDELAGYRFWVSDRSGKTRSLGIPTPQPEDHEYYDALTDLAHDLARELKRLKAVQEKAPEKLHEPEPVERRDQEGLSDDSLSAVFLAEVTDDLDLKRDEVKRYLSQSGLRILPESFYPREPKAFQQAVARDLDHCKLFVQLLSAFPGKRSSDLPQGYARLQYERALEKGATILQWRSPDLDPNTVEPDDHRALLEESTVLATGLEELKREVRKRALARPKPPPPTTNAFVFVDNDRDDRALADRICDVLARHGAGSVLPLESGSPTEIREDLERNLRECDAMIVIYGNSTAAWVRKQLLQCRKILFQREHPLRALAVFEGPPEEKAPLGLRLPNLTTLDCREGTIDDEIASFLSNLAAESP